MHLMQVAPQAARARFKLTQEQYESPEELLEAACRGRGWLLSGGRVDTDRGLGADSGRIPRRQGGEDQRWKRRLRGGRSMRETKEAKLERLTQTGKCPVGQRPGAWPAWTRWAGGRWRGRW